MEGLTFIHPTLAKLTLRKALELELIDCLGRAAGR